MSAALKTAKGSFRSRLQDAQERTSSVVDEEAYVRWDQGMTELAVGRPTLTWTGPARSGRTTLAYRLSAAIGRQPVPDAIKEGMVAATPGFVPCVEMPFEPIRLDAPTIDVETTNGYIAP